jgi:hypothetical protein
MCYYIKRKILDSKQKLALMAKPRLGLHTCVHHHQSSETLISNYDDMDAICIRKVAVQEVSPHLDATLQGADGGKRRSNVTSGEKRIDTQNRN